MAGMRSCTSATREFGLVVRIVQVSRILFFGSRHLSHSPANANTEPVTRPKLCACFLLRPYFLPFEKAVRRNETPQSFDCVAEGGFLRRGFRHRVYGFQAKRLIFCPVRNETPAHEAE